MNSAKILIAHNAEMMPTFSNSLYDFDLVTATRLAEAERVVMQDDVDLIVIGLHFDDSRAIDLATKIRQNKRHEFTPIIIIRTLPSKFAHVTRSMMAGFKAVGAITEFMEFGVGEEISKRLRLVLQRNLQTNLEISLSSVQTRLRIQLEAAIVMRD